MDFKDPFTVGQPDKNIESLCTKYLKKRNWTFICGCPIDEAFCSCESQWSFELAEAKMRKP